MKYVIRYWLNDKTACMYKLVHVVISVITIAINAKVVVLLSNALSDIGHIMDHISILVTVFAAQTILGAIRTHLENLCLDHQYTNLHGLYIDKILDAEYTMFTDISCSKVFTASEQMRRITQCGDLLTDTVICVATIIVTLYNMYIMGGNVVIPVMIIYAASILVFKALFKLYSKLDKRSDRAKLTRNQEVEECINGFAEVRSFCTQEHHRASIKGADQTVYEIRKKRSLVNAAIGASIDIIDSVGAIIVLLYVVNEMSKGLLNMAQGYSMIMYVWRLTDPLSKIVDYVGLLSERLSMMDLFNSVMEYESTHTDGHVELTSFDNSIKFESVSFAYGDSDEVLSDVSMMIRKGTKVGICGTSGGGKSTLLKLLTKFYVPSSGSILIDGIDSRSFENNSLRSKLAIVHQDNHILNSSIYDNIVYGNWNCTEYDVIEACKKANIYEFIQSLPNRFDTIVGPRGLKLSGGQKQRIALARVFLSDSEIILLDEATSALDNECESIIQDALEQFDGKTVITVAHRLSTIKDSDVIYVIGNHTVTESGTHKQLLKAGGTYASMYKQYKTD